MTISMLSSIWNSIKRFFGGGDDEVEESHHSHHIHHEDHDVELTEKQRFARKQIEFYFSPSNVQRDSLMLQLINEDENRYVPISRFLTFSLIKQLEIPEEEIAEALCTSHKLEVDPTKTLVRTVKPFTPDDRIDFKTIFIQGLNQDETLDNLREIFEKQFGKVYYIRMYKYKKNNKQIFNGKVDVDLSSERRAQKAKEAGLDYNGEYLPVQIVGEMKNEGIEEEPKAKSSGKRGRRSKPKATV